MAEGPFAGAGTGMFGFEKSYISSATKGGDSADDGKGGGPLGTFLAGLIGLSSQKKPETVPGAVPPGPVSMNAMGSAPQQYDLQTAFPEVFHQQYASPYAPAYTPVAPVAPASASSLPGFQKPASFAMQPQTATSINNLLWER